MKILIDKVIKWHEDRNLIEGSTDKDQVLKLQQELGELSDSVCKQKDVRDDLGDMMVIMLNIMKRNDVTMEECLETAYNDIKDRKGKMVDGIFVKEKMIFSLLKNMILQTGRIRNARPFETNVTLNVTDNNTFIII